MRSIDQRAIGGNTDIGFTYMLKAGMGLFEEVTKLISGRDAGEIAIVCGKGNNGGDGYVIGKLLKENGYRVVCLGFSGGDKLEGEAKRAYDEYISKKGEFIEVTNSDLLKGFKNNALIIDAILGTGLSGDPKGIVADTIRIMNNSGKKVLAVDTPSGLNNETGFPGSPTVCASTTVTMGFPKIGQLFYPGRLNVGSLVVRDLGYPADIVRENHSDIYLPTRKSLKQLLPLRKPAGSKFDHGLALMVCGSKGMTGSASLAAASALKSGCGMVHMAVPESTVDVLSIKLTEPVIYGMPETGAGALASSSLYSILDLSERMQAVLVGPGLTHNKETAEMIRNLISKLKKPVILDADGINAYKEHVPVLKSRTCELVISPHEGEWSRLFGPLSSEPVKRIGALRDVAKEYKMTILLKGNPTIIVGSSGEAYIVPLGNSGMATAGSGDVLSGILVSLAAQGCRPLDSAVLGACVHGLSGESASIKLGEYSVAASDILIYINKTLQSLSSSPVRLGILPEC